MAKEVIRLPEEKNPLIIVLGFWGVVNSPLSIPLTKNERVLVDYMVGKIDKQSAVIKLHNLGLPTDKNGLDRILKESGWSAMFEAAGSNDFFIDFHQTLISLRDSYPTAMIGLAFNEPLYLNEMLKETKLNMELDFIINPKLYAPDPNFKYHGKIKELFDNIGKIVFVGECFIDECRESGHEIIIYNNEHNDSLIDAINRHFR